MTTTFAYDTLGRLKSKSADPSHPSLAYSNAIAKIEYDYDDDGRRTAARTYNKAGTLLYSESTPRDPRGRVQYKQEQGVRLDYSYFDNGLLKDVVSSDSGGVNVGYRYDELNRLAHVDDASGVAGTLHTTDYGYDANNNLQSIALPNGITQTYAYDSLNRLRTLSVAQVTAMGGPVVGTVDHAYELKLTASGHRSQVIEGGTTTTYAYDALYRLTGETVVGGDANRPNRTLSYTLDKVGNRLSRTSDLAAVPTRTSQTYNARDWLAGDAYDSNGNTTTGIILDSRSSLPTSSTSGTDVYDFEDRLIARQKPDGTSLTLAYDADGIRIGKTLFDTSGSVTRSTSYLVDTNNLTGYAQVFEETTTASSATTSKVFTYGTSLLSYTLSASSPALSSSNGLPASHFFLTDGGGSVRELADDTGAITDRYDYDAFGDLTATSGTTDNAYLYRGEQYDVDLGLYYLRARYMNPDSGRFWNADTYEGANADPISLHRYLYASGDPVLRRDPSGNFTLVETEESSEVSAEEDAGSLPNVRQITQRAAAGKIAQIFLGFGPGLTSELFGHSFIFLEFANEPEGIYYDANPQRGGIIQLGGLWRAGAYAKFATAEVPGMINEIPMPKSQVRGTLIKIPGASLNFRQVLEWRMAMRVVSPEITYKFLSIPGGSSYSCYTWAVTAVVQAWIIARF